jgi:hypothetical protein
MIAALRIASAFVLLGLLAGCAHYQLGTQGRTAFRTLYIAPVDNQAPSLAQAVALVTTQARETFARDGRVTLVASPEQADATLTIVLTDYRRETLTVRPDDTGLARKFGLDLTAVCTLKDNRAGTLLFEARPVQATRQIFTDSGQLQAEYQALPLLSESLAQAIAHAVLDVW